VNLILSKPMDHALEDVQLTDEHGSLVVSSNNSADEEDLLDAGQLHNFYWHEETIAGNAKILTLVTIDGFILILFWVVESGNWEITDIMMLASIHKSLDSLINIPVYI